MPILFNDEMTWANSKGYIKTVLVVDLFFRFVVVVQYLVSFGGL